MTNTEKLTEALEAAYQADDAEMIHRTLRLMARQADYRTWYAERYRKERDAR